MLHMISYTVHEWVVTPYEVYSRWEQEIHTGCTHDDDEEVADHAEEEYDEVEAAEDGAEPVVAHQRLLGAVVVHGGVVGPVVAGGGHVAHGRVVVKWRRHYLYGLPENSTKR